MDFQLLLNAMPLELASLLPELFLATGILLALVSEFVPGGSPRATVWFSSLIALCSLVIAGISPAIFEAPRMNMSFQPDPLTQFVRLYASLGALLTLLAMAGSSRWKNRAEQGEAAILILSVSLGAMFFASASNLLSLLLSLEFLSLCSYGLAGFRGRDRRAAEAGLKYVLYGGVASAIALFGASHLFGMTGSLDLSTIGAALAMGPSDPAVLVPVLLVGAAFGYKLSLVPFHFWGPDVYQGCPALSAGFLSTVPKAAGFAGLIHTLLLLFPSWSTLVPGSSLPLFLAVFGCVSTLVGAVAAGMQKDARRVLAFSSTANAGTMLLVLSSWVTAEALAALGFFLIVYLFSNIGAFAALDRLEGDSRAKGTAALAGSWKRNPGTVLAFGVCLFSLAGIPPLAGFTAKWAVLREIFRAGTDGGLGMVSLIVAAVVLVSAVSLAWAYLGILRSTAIDEAETDETTPGAKGAGFVLGLCAIALLGLGWGWPVLDLLRRHLAG